MFDSTTREEDELTVHKHHFVLEAVRRLSLLRFASLNVGEKVVEGVTVGDNTVGSKSEDCVAASVAERAIEILTCPPSLIRSFCESSRLNT